MDFTPPLPQSQHLKASARKLPIKRKIPDPHPILNPNPNFLSPICDHDNNNDVVFSAEDGQGLDARPPPFKFHRTSKEPDELRFLQGLFGCASQGQSFPKDLHLFYARFANTMSQPYTKSQLSEKVRRLRKKFRVVSARLARGGLYESQLSPHHRALYDLSKKLWSPEYWSTSPFGNKTKSAADDNLVMDGNQKQSVSDDLYVENDYADEVRTSDLIVDSGFGGNGNGKELSRPIAGLTAKTVLDVFDQSLNEVRMVLVKQGLLYPDPVGSGSGLCSSDEGKPAADFERRWQFQRLVELDVLAQRLRLVIDNSIKGQ